MPIFRNEHDNTFTYSATDRAPPFPLDYTTGELMKKWNVSWDNLIKRMFTHPQFLDFFLWIQYDDKTLKAKDEDHNQEETPASKRDFTNIKPYNGLPPELEPFMRLYMEGYTRARDGKASVDFDCFIPDFCNYLHSLEMNAELNAFPTHSASESNSARDTSETPPEISAPDDRYWYRLLYKNEGFQEAIINSYWKKEYDSRTKTAKELFLKMPYDFQMQALMQNICYLDTQIAAMLQTIEQNKAYIPASNRTSSFLKTFPTELMNSLRPKVPVSKDLERATFSIKNFTIHKPAASQDKDLLLYLNEIVDDQNPEVVKKEIRPYYLQEICQVPDVPPFLAECLRLQKYLDSNTNSNGNWADIENYVYAKSLDLYQAALRFDPFPLPTMLQFRNDHIGSMVDQLIFNMYNSFMGLYGQDFDYLRYWLNFRPSEQNITHLSPTIIPDQEDVSKLFLDVYNVALNMVYSISGKTLTIPVLSWNEYVSILLKLVGTDIYADFHVLYEPLSDAVISNLSAHLVKTCCDAYKYMNLEAPDWILEATFRTAWHHYSQSLAHNKAKNAKGINKTATADGTNTIGNTSDVEAPPSLIPTENYYLLAALMVQRTFQAYLTNCRTAISAYKNYMNFMEEQK